MKLRAFGSVSLLALSSLGLLHCSGDDTNPALPGSASTPDATAPLADASGGDGGKDGSVASDAGVLTDASADGSAVASECTFDEVSDGGASLLGIYTLPPTSMKVMVPALTDTDLTNAIANGAIITDDPGPGSGLEYGGGCLFYGIGDRGPTGSSNVDPNGVTFPMPAYTPTVMKLQIDPTTGALLVDGVVNALTPDGGPVTGISNSTSDDPPYLSRDAGTMLPYVQSGLDTEDVRRLPNGDLAFCEEYSPSLGILDGTTGEVKVRYVPTTVSLPNAGYPVVPIVPPVFTNRRLNKGFEGLAISSDGHTAYTVLQTPMGDTTTYGSSLVDRIVRIENFDGPTTAKVTGHFIVLHQSGVVFGNTKQSSVFYNSAIWLAQDKLLLLERGTGHLQLVVADLTTATNLVGHPALGEDALTPEAVGMDAGYAALGIVPAATTTVFNSDEVSTFLANPPDGGTVPDKLEGLAIINRTTVSIANDNDFGITDTTDRSRIWILRLKAPLPN